MKQKSVDIGGHYTYTTLYGQQFCCLDIILFISIKNKNLYGLHNVFMYKINSI